MSTNNDTSSGTVDLVAMSNRANSQTKSTKPSKISAPFRAIATVVKAIFKAIAAAFTAVFGKRSSQSEAVVEATTTTTTATTATTTTTATTADTPTTTADTRTTTATTATFKPQPHSHSYNTARPMNSWTVDV